MFKAVFTSSIDIRANIDRVWQNIIDFDSYVEWNGFTPEVDITLELGKPVVLTVMMEGSNKPILHKARLSSLQPPYKIGWTMNWGPLLMAERIQVLQEKEDGTTHYYTSDTNKGLLAPLVQWMYGKKITRGFQKVAASLKARSEMQSNASEDQRMDGE